MSDEMNVLEHNNRIDYGQSLMPDEGWTTSWAIGTTYSLDLEVLMGIPLALFHGKYLSEKTDIRNLRADMLDALNKVKDRMFIFVHDNNISVDCSFSMLMSFLDQNIWNINLKDAYQNFHPKIWLVRYERSIPENDFKYRLIVMSRNITTASDFDIAVTMDSYHCNEVHHENDSLLEVMSALMKRTNHGKIISQMRKELGTVCFQPPAPFDMKHAIFFPHTFKELKCPLISNERYKELMVISPFVDDATLQDLADKTDSKPILVGREFEMDKCSPATLIKWDCYQWNPVLEEASEYEENETADDETKSFGIGLHAKIFIAKAALGRDMKLWNNWFVGSTNCTKAGMERNYEAMLQLRSDSKETSPENVLSSLLNPEAPLIQKYTIKDKALHQEEMAKQKIMREIVYAVSQLKFKAGLIVDENDKYITEVSVDETSSGKIKSKYPNVRITMQLFASDLDSWDVTKECSHQFKKLYCQQLSPFARVKVEYAGDQKDFLLKLPLEIPEERQGRVMAEILDSEEKLMRYLMFCLDPLMDQEQQEIGSELPKYHCGVSDGYQDYTYPLYERMLLAASRDHKALAEIGRNVERLKNVKGKDGKPLLSDAFLKMWNLFSVYAK